MPQEFQVLQCFGCQTFQVHQVKKAPKWVCKMCGEKQSLKKVFGRGSGADCRQHVQRLNTLRADLDQQATSSYNIQSLTNMPSEDDDHSNGSGQHYFTYDLCPDEEQHERHHQDRPREETKWNMFVERTCQDLPDDDVDNDDRYTTDAQKFKQGRKRKRESKTGNTRSEKWCQYTSDYGKEYSHDYDSSAMNRPTSTASDFRAHQKMSSECSSKYREESNAVGRFENENYSDNNFVNSSQRRKEWYTAEPNESPSQKSTVGTPLDRIQVQSCSSRNLEIKQSGDENHEINTQMNTKWNMFTEIDTSSQESSSINSQVTTENSYDSRPYVIFEPEYVDHFVKLLPSSSGKTAVSRQSESNTNSTKTNEYSKWTGFVTLKESVDQSEQNDTVHSRQNTSKQTGFMTYRNIDKQSGQNNASKWTDYLADKENESSSIQNFERFDIDKKEDLDSYSPTNAVERLIEVTSVENKQRSSRAPEPLSYNKMTQENQECTRAFKGIHKLGNTDSFHRIEKVSPVFAVDDLDDEDFEL